MKGFTLIEVVVALVTGALLVLMAHLFFSTTARAADRINAAADRATVAANARRLLRQCAGSIDIGVARGARFNGATQQAEFPCRAFGSATRLEFVRLVTDSSRFLLLVRRDTVVLADGVADLRLEYLAQRGAHQAWLAEWQSLVTTPAAIRVRFTLDDGRTDTTLFAVGPRG